ncbi:MAG TPA: Crp/Fnr family transcriptional regulator [Gemmatimonadaceae bacterium]|jgi:CRP/FNR family transcriptional regulator, cyclic AMP receptor protein|nr:Crp/Fnr family transcriptional regulator [Gemmatimonadaceae bacterium]
MTMARPAEGSSAAIVELLRQMPIFAELEDTTIHQLAARCVTRDFGVGRVLFTAGDACRGLYMIQSGRVRIYRTSPDGKEQILHIEGPGRPVAELPLFDGGPYPASAITLEPSRLMFLARDDFEAMYREHPDVAHGVIRALGKRLRHLVQVTETLAFHDVAARLAMLLVGYTERSGLPTPLGIEITLDRTQEELSMEIGSARESVSRAMRQLKRTGLVQSLPRGRLRIPDVAKLRSRAQGR